MGKHGQRKGEDNFDVAQGAYDSAEICDIVGLFLLSELKKQKLNANLGIYRDDGLGVSSATPRQVDKIKKKICEVYRQHGLSLTVENVNKNVVQFLDVELNLEKNTYKPFIKENDVPLYVHSDSNHPPVVLKNIPESINRRLSALSSSEEMFLSVVQKYQPSGAGGTRSPPATPHRLQHLPAHFFQNGRWGPGIGQTLGYWTL